MPSYAHKSRSLSHLHIILKLFMYMQPVVNNGQLIYLDIIMQKSFKAILHL